MKIVKRPQSPPDFIAQAPAKINLFLEVLSRRDDGFHQLETVMQTIDLCDSLEFWINNTGKISLSVSGGPAPTGPENLVVRAARALQNKSGPGRGAHIHLEKRIPSGAGLGGGSSDAATTLTALNRLWALSQTLEDLGRTAANLGSDINFFLHGGLALCRGRGEIIRPLEDSCDYVVFLVLPQLAVPTADVYAALNLRLTDKPNRCNSILSALAERNLEAIGGKAFNRLEVPCFMLYPQIGEIKNKAAKCGGLSALMSGSGSTIFVLTSVKSAEDVERALRSANLGARVLKSCPLPRAD
jgi:4-diphosphocytidyl-2-C-methyl-D-erythritol kinase